MTKLRKKRLLLCAQRLNCNLRKWYPEYKQLEDWGYTRWLNGLGVPTLTIQGDDWLKENS